MLFIAIIMNIKVKNIRTKRKSIKENLIRDIINDHKTREEWKVNVGNAVNDYKTQVEWKIQLIMIINFISSIDSLEIRTMRTKNNNIESMMANETHEIIEKCFEPLLQKYQARLEERMRGSEFVFNSNDLLHYNLHKISLNTGGSSTDSHEWLKN